MTPSNPSNQNPFILCIMDARGIPHQVAPLEHTHSYAEVPGLADEISELWAGVNEKADQEAMTEALTAKQDALTFDSTPTVNSTNPVTSGGVAAALAQKANKILIDNTVSGVGRAFIQLGTDDETEIHVEIQVAKNGVTDNADITVDNIPNLQRALQTPDSTPTSNSNNLVTSGGVKAAIDEATKATFGSSLPYYITAAHEKMKVYTRVLHNNSGSTMQLFECIDVSSLPAEERTNVWWNADVRTEIPNNTTFAIRFMRAANGVYCWFDGTFDY